MKEYFGELELIEIHGFKMYVYSRSQFIVPFLKLRTYETDVFNEFIITLRPGDMAVDVGACMGCYTLLAAKIVGEEGHVYAFEPEPNLCQLIKTNLELNQYENVTIIQKALWDKPTKLTLSVSRTNVGGHTVIERLKDEAYATEVEATSLDEYFKNISKPIKLIKIDAEGAEYPIIKGAINKLRKNNVQKIIVEARLNNIIPITDLLQTKGYRIYFPGNRDFKFSTIYELCKTFEHINVVFDREEI